jgi:hypothetical protein
MLQERWLFDCQLNILQEIHQDFNGAGKSVDPNDPISPYQMPRGYAGVAILWRKDLDSYITPLQVGNERIQYVCTSFCSLFTSRLYLNTFCVSLVRFVCFLKNSCY